MLSIIRCPSLLGRLCIAFHHPLRAVPASRIGVMTSQWFFKAARPCIQQAYRGARFTPTRHSQAAITAVAKDSYLVFGVLLTKVLWTLRVPALPQKLGCYEEGRRRLPKTVTNR
jgi:hypothetical protein